MDEMKDSASAHESRDDKQRYCFFCLDGWVFLGSIDHDGVEIIESIRCRHCGGMRRSAQTENFA